MRAHVHKRWQSAGMKLLCGERKKRYMLVLTLASRAGNLLESHVSICFRFLGVRKLTSKLTQIRFSVQNGLLNTYKSGHYFQSLSPIYFVPNHSLVSLIHWYRLYFKKLTVLIIELTTFPASLEPCLYMSNKLSGRRSTPLSSTFPFHEHHVNNIVNGVDRNWHSYLPVDWIDVLKVIVIFNSKCSEGAHKKGRQGTNSVAEINTHLHTWNLLVTGCST